MKLKFLLCFLCPAVTAIGQSPLASRRKIDFGKLPVERKQVSNSPIQVILALSDTTALGYAHPLHGNETSTLVGESHPTNWMNQSVSKRFTGKATIRSTWIIRQLSFTTDTSGNIGFAHVAADLYKPVDQLTQSRLSLDTVLSFSLQDTVAYSKALDQIVSLCFSWSGQLLTGTNSYQSVSLQQLIDSAGTKAIQPGMSLRNKGIYNSYQELVRNEPSVTTPFWIVPDTNATNGSVKIIAMNEDSSTHEITGAWAICFGGNELYKNESGQLIPIEPSGNNYILSRFQPPIQRKNNALVWRRVINVGWPGDANPYERKRSFTIPTKTAGSKSAYLPVATRLDEQTGTLTF